MKRGGTKIYQATPKVRSADTRRDAMETAGCDVRQAEAGVARLNPDGGAASFISHLANIKDSLSIQLINSAVTTYATHLTQQQLGKCIYVTLSTSLSI